MICPQCKCEYDQASVFCAKCGAKLVPEQKPAEEASQPNVHQYPQNAEFGNNYFPPPYQKARSKKKPVIITLIAVILVGAIITGVLIASAYTGPVAVISKAFDKTLNSKSLSFEGEIRSHGEIIKLEGTMLFSPKTRILELYMESKYSSSNGRTETTTFILKNGVMVYDEGDYIWSDNVKEALDEFFDEYQKHLTAGRVEDVDWKEVFNYLDIDSDNIDYNLFGKVLKGFMKNLNEEEYINQRIAGYTVEKKDRSITHSFRFDADVLAKELVDVFGEAFGLKSDYDKRDAEIDLKNQVVWGTGDSRFGVHLITTGGYLSGVTIDMKSFYCKCEMWDFGKAEIAQSILEKYSDYLNK